MQEVAHVQVEARDEGGERDGYQIMQGFVGPDRAIRFHTGKMESH